MLLAWQRLDTENIIGWIACGSGMYGIATVKKRMTTVCSTLEWLSGKIVHCKPQGSAECM